MTTNLPNPFMDAPLVQKRENERLVARLDDADRQALIDVIGESAVIGAIREWDELMRRVAS